jgi:GAF domain
VPDTLTDLEQQIASEERIVGIPTDQPLTNAAIVRRHVQIGVLLGLVSLVAVATLLSALRSWRIWTSALALAFGVYALVKERHLDRLAHLYRDECSIHLRVADRLLASGFMQADQELLGLRLAVEVGAARIAAELADTMLAHCASVRLIGPSGETPLAAVCDLEEAGVWLDPSAAREAIARHEPIRRGAPDGRTVIAVPLEHHYEAVGVIEVVSGPAEPYGARDAELVSAFARGAVSGLLGSRRPPDTP